MKKAFRGINIAVILVALIATMTACNSYSWDAVGTTADSDKEATGNGTLYVQQGSYVYFVNGVVDDSSLTKADNEWGKASVKGSIFKAKVGDDGSLTVMGVVVPKLFISDYSDAGLYVYGQWIYYVTRSLKTDKNTAEKLFGTKPLNIFKKTANYSKRTGLLTKVKHVTQKITSSIKGFVGNLFA